MKIRDHLIAARDHQKRVGVHVGSMYAGRAGEYDSPCCMMGALDATYPGCGTGPAYSHLFDTIKVVHGDLGVSGFNDQYAHSPTLWAMWERAIGTAPDKDVK